MVVTAIIGVFFLLRPYWEATDRIRGYSGIGKLDSSPTIGKNENVNISINTYSDNIPKWCIAHLFLLAYQKLRTEHGEDCKLYTWRDPEGYRRIAAVVTLGSDNNNKFVIAQASNNNDNDAFILKFPVDNWEANGKEAIIDSEKIGQILKW